MSNAEGEIGRAALMQAGSRNVLFNCPLAGERAAALAAWLGTQGPASLVDLGCGRGGFLREVRNVLPEAELIGVDSDEPSIEDARVLSGAAGGVEWVLGDAAVWPRKVEAAVCLGSSHAFGGTESMLSRMAALVADGCAVVGDAVFQAKPDAWCRKAFGDLPDGLEGLRGLAVASGWTVAEASLSTLDEWDAFEHGWIAGVRNLGVPEAEAFAEARSVDYPRYRGVLGFGWLQLTRGCSSPAKKS